jgi:hypothetical protein
MIDFAIKIETLGGVRIITHHRAGDADMEHDSNNRNNDFDINDGSFGSILIPSDATLAAARAPSLTNNGHHHIIMPKGNSSRAAAAGINLNGSDYYNDDDGDDDDDDTVDHPLQIAAEAAWRASLSARTARPLEPPHAHSIPTSTSPIETSKVSITKGDGDINTVSVDRVNDGNGNGNGHRATIVVDYHASTSVINNNDRVIRSDASVSIPNDNNDDTLTRPYSSTLVVDYTENTNTSTNLPTAAASTANTTINNTNA